MKCKWERLPRGAFDVGICDAAGDTQRERSVWNVFSIAWGGGGGRI